MITFGVDSEFFIKDGNKYISADLVFPKKEEAIKLKNIDAIAYFDGFQGEITFLKPFSSTKEAYNSVVIAYREIQDYLKDKKLTLDFSPSIRVNPKELKNRDKRVNEFLCEPDISIYPIMQVRVNKNHYKFRYAGSHIHVGFDDEKIRNEIHKDPYLFIKLMDIFVGLPNNFITDRNKEIHRRKLYGQAGRFRKTDYGIEYRTLSSSWISYPQTLLYNFDATDFVINLYITSRNFAEIIASNIDDFMLLHSINNLDLKTSKALISIVEDIMHEEEIAFPQIHTLQQNSAMMKEPDFYKFKLIG